MRNLVIVLAAMFVLSACDKSPCSCTASLDNDTSITKF